MKEFLKKREVRPSDEIFISHIKETSRTSNFEKEKRWIIKEIFAFVKETLLNKKR